MKIEMGESLMQSYLKHIKTCLLTETNWKVSSVWQKYGLSKAEELYKKISNHTEFSNIFKGVSLEQTLRQAEIDVIGVNENKIYLVEVAFHENGLQYGDKGKTKNRVCEKMLRAYLIGLTYFPNYSYEIIFASPKVNPATEKILENSFSILEKDFEEKEKISFEYFAGNKFKNEVLIPTLLISTSDSDTSELFLRSSRLLNIFNLLDFKK